MHRQWYRSAKPGKDSNKGIMAGETPNALRGSFTNAVAPPVRIFHTFQVCYCCNRLFTNQYRLTTCKKRLKARHQHPHRNEKASL